LALPLIKLRLPIMALYDPVTVFWYPVIELEWDAANIWIYGKISRSLYNRLVGIEVRWVKILNKLVFRRIK
jgi:hypothetical protein